MSSSVSKFPALPPEIQGVAQGQARIEIRRIHLLRLKGEPLRVDICWWGQRDCDSVPVSKNGVGKRAVIYDVVTNHERFVQYLNDAKKLFLKVVAANKAVGFACVDQLARILDGISEESAIVDEEGNHVGEIVYALEYASEVANPKVTISSKKRVPQSASSLPSTPVKHASPHIKPATSMDDIQRPPSAKTVSFKADADIAEIRSVLAHSKERLELFSRRPNRPQQRPPLPTAPYNHGENRIPAPASTSIHSDDSTPNSSSHAIGTTTHARGGGLLPSWNLNTARLRFISSVSELVVNVERVRLTKAAIDHISSTRHKKITLSSRGNRSGGNSAVSLFVSYTIPPGDEKVQFCARKGARRIGTTADKNDVVFDQRSSHPTVFKPELMDTWWTSDIVFKIHSRTLGQRVPTLIGEARLGMKLLLMGAENSSGKLLKLPLYASQEFLRAEGHNFKSEIVGDFFVSFDLKCGRRFPNISLGSVPPSNNHRTVPSEKPVKDTDSDEHIYDEAEDSDPFAVSGARVRPRVSLPSEARSGTTVYVLLQVVEGRSFALVNPASSSASTPSLFVSCRFFSPTDMAKSGVAWNTTRPSFNMQHRVPFTLTEEFIDRCRENFLVIEVWNFLDANNDDNDLVGVVMVPLHQFYTSLKIQSRRRITLDADLPVVAVNDWMPVIDLKTGTEKGQLRINLAAGTERQIAHLVMPGWRPESREALNEDEHIYDSVHDGDDGDDGDDDDDSAVLCGGEESEAGRVEGDDEEEEVEVAVQEGEWEGESSFFSAVVRIEEGQNLPHKRTPPSTYLTFASSRPPVVVTDIAHRTTRPKWNFERHVDIASDVLTDPRRHFILKLWKCGKSDEDVDLNRDHVIGFVAVDLAPLCLPGFPKISGWYNVMDFVGRCRGQVKVSVTPAEDLSKQADCRKLRRRISEVSSTVGNDDGARFVTSGRYAAFPSHLVQYTEQAISPSPVQDFGQALSTNASQKDLGPKGGWQPPELPSLDEAQSTHSFLDRKLREMAGTTEQLKERLCGGGSRAPGESAADVRRAEEAEHAAPSADLQSMTVDELQRVIEGRLKTIRLQNGAENRGEDEGRSGSRLESMEEIDLVSPSTSSQRSTPDLSAVSAEIAGVIGTDAVANTDMPDLGEIDWAHVMRHDRVETVSVSEHEQVEDNAQSRQGPEGGNPAEDDRVGSTSRPTGPPAKDGTGS